MRRAVCMLLVVVALLSGGVLDLCRCAPPQSDAARADLDATGCGCCEPSAPSCCCAPAEPHGGAGQGLVADRRCDCPVVALAAPAAEPVPDAARDADPGPSPTVLAGTAGPLDARREPVEVHGLGPPPDPGRPRHLLLHVLRR